MDYPWPGNVRELENAIEHAFVLCQGNTILPEHLPIDLHDKNHSLSSAVFEPDPLGAAERVVLQEMLEITGGHRQKMAERLGISLPTLWRKLKKHELLDQTSGLQPCR